MAKKLNIAFVWHFHQPSYQESFDKDFLMPWVRLHATKDYLDMLYYVDNFKKLKLNFNFSPVLIDSIERYTKGIHDVHSRLLISDIEKLSPQDKFFILDNFFDANYANLILPREHYTELYNKRYAKEHVNTDEFSDQEYSDIMANFTLAWMDKTFINQYDDLGALFAKGKGYTFEDRQRLYEISLDILKKLIPTYKKYQDRGRIEISTAPYYHPLLPLLLNINEQRCVYSQNLPLNPKVMENEALSQTKKALDRFEDVFGKRPKGVWLPEHCISEKTVEMLNKLDVCWTISDEGIVASSLGKEFQRDFEGNLQDPFHLGVSYKLKGKNKTNILFADSFMMNLISFGYGNYEPELAANDLYEKIKQGQNKLLNSPHDEHLLTIAMDGENCWESYRNDGADFLNALYDLIEQDETLETVLLDEYLAKTKHTVKLDKLASGSWINRNFDLWIGEPVKNLAWSYLSTAIEDFREFEQSTNDKKIIEDAYEEIQLCQASDWFWWYGEPNESGRDHIFDYIFRERLKNVYKIFGKEHPSHLDIPLISMVGKPIRQPRKSITPIVEGKYSKGIDAWQDGGYIVLPDSPTFSGQKIIKGIHYGSDENYMYFYFELNRAKMHNIADKKFGYDQISVYFRTENSPLYSRIRLANRGSTIPPILKNKFSHEARLLVSKDKIHQIDFLKATTDGLWLAKNREYLNRYEGAIELRVPFSDLGIENGEKVDFLVIEAKNGVSDGVYPQDLLLSLTRA